MEAREWIKALRLAIEAERFAALEYKDAYASLRISAEYVRMSDSTDPMYATSIRTRAHNMRTAADLWDKYTAAREETERILCRLRGTAIFSVFK